MQRIIPFIVFFAALAYLFYGPAPMDEIGETVKNRSCYQLRLIDQKRLSISTEKINAIDQPTATIQKENLSKEKASAHKRIQSDFSLAMSQRNN